MNPNFRPFVNFIKNHYNNTKTYGFYDSNAHQFEIVTYTEPVKQIILSDVFTVGVLYYILSNL